MTRIETAGPKAAGEQSVCSGPDLVRGADAEQGVDPSAISVAILAGGYGKRLGRDKAKLRLGEEISLQRVVRRLGPLSEDVIVVRRRDQAVDIGGVRVVADLEPFNGPLAGIAAGITSARHPWCFLAACDMPFIDLDLVLYMLTLRTGVDAVVPHPAPGHEPLHALYHRACLASVLDRLERGEKRLRGFYSELRVRFVTPHEIASIDPDQLSFLNINTPEDLRNARELVASER